VETFRSSPSIFKRFTAEDDHVVVLIRVGVAGRLGGLNSGRMTKQKERTTVHTHQTAPTQFIEAAGIRFAYRRFGKKQSVPLVFFMHFTGTMDHWDPAITDGMTADREVILFRQRGHFQFERRSANFHRRDG
jgi:hypothetical protein